MLQYDGTLYRGYVCVLYNSDKISLFVDILYMMFGENHDPMQYIIYQGSDHGSQYWSEYFYFKNEDQKRLIEMLQRVHARRHWEKMKDCN